MLDLNNRQLVKLMWLPGEGEVLFNMKSGEEIPGSSELYDVLSQHLNITEWVGAYASLYSDWLNHDRNDIYDLNHDINVRVINALVKVNELLADKAIFYWFDVDRTFLEQEFEWKVCPISNEPLVNLGKDYSVYNSLVSPVYPLVFPMSGLRDTDE